MHDQVSKLMRSLCAAAVLVVVSQSAAPAGDDPVDVVVKTVSQDAIAGRLVSFSLERGLVLVPAGTADQHRVSAADIVRIATHSAISTRAAGKATVTLTGGDRLIGTPKGFADDHVVTEVPSLGSVRVPLERVTVWRTPQDAHKAWAPDEIESALPKPPAGVDLLLLTNGDRIEGIVTVIDASGFTMETSLGSSRIDHGRVVAAVITSAPPISARGLRARIQLVDGSRVTADRLRWAGASVVARIFDDTEIQISASRIAYVEVVGGRWQWLTSLTPISVEQTPMMSVHWPCIHDRNVQGGPLRVGGRLFEHGLGVHSRSLLTYDLRGEYSEFVTSYGMDDDSGPLADVTVSIRVDGQLRHRQESVRRGDLSGPVRMDVSGAGRIELVVDFGQFGGIQDRFDWIEPALTYPHP